MKSKKSARTLEGIIRSVGGGNNGGDAWDLVVFLAPWRESQGPIVKREVRLIVPIGKSAALKRAIARHKPGHAIALDLTTIERKKGYSWWSAFGSGPIRAGDAAPFQKEVKRQAQPRVFEDETLGRLLLDRDMGWYQVDRRLARKAYTLSIVTPDPDDDGKVARRIAAAVPRVLALEAGWSALLDAATEELLGDHNETWRQGGRPLSAAAFRKKLAPSEVHVGEGRITVYLTSGDLFADHGVEIRIPHRGKRREILIS